jgi:hypothetical protein
MSNHEELVEKLVTQAAGERALGNHDAATSFELKADKLRQKYNLTAPQPVTQDDAEAARRKVEERWEKIPPSTQVIIEVLEPGMHRTTQRLTTMEVALPLLKSESAKLVRRVNGNNEITFAPQEVAEPKEKTIWFL